MEIKKAKKEEDKQSYSSPVRFEFIKAFIELTGPCFKNTE